VNSIRKISDETIGKSSHKYKKRRIRNAVKQMCGNTCSVCHRNRKDLQFHHVNPSDKLFNISDIYGKVGKEKLLVEIDKCILVCSSCHRKIHKEMRRR
jgi:hypothetical protein